MSEPEKKKRIPRAKQIKEEEKAPEPVEVKEKPKTARKRKAVSN